MNIELIDGSVIALRPLTVGDWITADSFGVKIEAGIEDPLVLGKLMSILVFLGQVERKIPTWEEVSQKITMKVIRQAGELLPFFMDLPAE